MKDALPDLPSALAFELDEERAPGQYRHGEKPLQKILIGDDSPRFIPIAMTMLRTMYRNTAPSLHMHQKVEEASIEVEKNPGADRITISIAPGGWLAGISFRIYFDSTVNYTITRLINVLKVMKASGLDKPWTPVGSNPSFAVPYGDGFYQNPWLAWQNAGLIPEYGSGTQETYAAEIAARERLEPFTGTRFLDVDRFDNNQTPNFPLIPMKGKVLSPMINIGDLSRPLTFTSSAYQPIFTRLDVSSDGGKSYPDVAFEEIFDVFVLSNSGRSIITSVREGERYATFMVMLSDGQYVIQAKESDQSFVGWRIWDRTDTFSRFIAKIVHTTPTRIYGYWASGAHFGFFFLIEIDTNLLTILPDIPLALENLVAVYPPSLIGLYPAGKDKLLVLAPTYPFGNRLFKINMLTGLQTLVLSIPGTRRIGEAQMVSMGNGCWVWIANRVEFRDGDGNIVGNGSLCYRSFDNGDTWTSDVFAFPQSTLSMGPSETSRLYTLQQIVVERPYVGDDDQGSMVVPSFRTLGEGSGEPTDVKLFRSIDLGLSWVEFGTILKREDFLETRTITQHIFQVDSHGTPFYDDEIRTSRDDNDLGRLIVLTPVGTVNNPLPIDPIQPWRCDDSSSPPSTWLS